MPSCLLKSLRCVVNGLHCCTVQNWNGGGAQSWTKSEQLAGVGEMPSVPGQKTKTKPEKSLKKVCAFTTLVYTYC